MKKALIVSPYLDHLGGGERYMLSAASALEDLGYSIYFGWDNLADINKLSEMLGVTLKNPQLATNIKSLYFGRNPFSMYLATKAYDLVFYLSDGSLPLLGSKNNLVHMQVPFHGVNGQSLKNKFKKSFINSIVVNSDFTKRVIDKEFGLSSVVLYPPVQPIIHDSVKENIILSVGRFEPSLNAKHQDVLIEAYKQLNTNLPGWKLVLAGGCSSEEWLSKLKAQGAGFAIDFYPNISHPDLSALYSRSKIYWHAAGYQVDEQKNPELTEHFGITTVEAISAGCIPLVVPYGGQKEIVKDEAFHWENITELVAKTIAIANSNPVLVVDVKSYSFESFKSQLAGMIKI